MVQSAISKIRTHNFGAEQASLNAAPREIVPLIYHWRTNHLKTWWLKTITSYIMILWV